MTTPEAERIGLGVTYVQGAAKVYMKTENPESIDATQMAHINSIKESVFTSLIERKFTKCDITKVLLLRAFEE